MPLLAIPNISIGTPGIGLDRALDGVRVGGVRVLDVHSDPVHGRTVLTVTGPSGDLVRAMGRLAVACSDVDLTQHSGVHPRLGVFDVCPIVPHETSMNMAVETAHRAGEEIARAAQIPVFFYGAAARLAEHRDLPAIRSGGHEGIMQRVADGIAPDAGPATIDPRVGVVCVGARGPLIAFNVWVESTVEQAREIARGVRDEQGIRALGLEIADGRCQISMNLIQPDLIGIDEAFDRVERAAQVRRVEVTATEIVGLVPRVFLPDPDAKAARLLIEPGRSLESALSV